MFMVLLAFRAGAPAAQQRRAGADEVLDRVVAEEGRAKLAAAPIIRRSRTAAPRSGRRGSPRSGPAMSIPKVSGSM
jgi:hypothetical protein